MSGTWFGWGVVGFQLTVAFWMACQRRINRSLTSDVARLKRLLDRERVTS